MTNVAAPPTVVVGVKDKGRSRGAIRLAAREAGYRGPRCAEAEPLQQVP